MTTTKHDNAVRARCAAAAVRAYAKAKSKTHTDLYDFSAEGAQERLTDLLADLMHWASAHHLDFADAQRIARNHFDAELAGGAAGRAEDTARDVLREFVEDVKLIHGTGRGHAIDEAALDWPDLAITYQKALGVLRHSQPSKATPGPALTITVQGGVVQGVYASFDRGDVEVIDYDNAPDGRALEQTATARINTLTPHALF